MSTARRFSIAVTRLLDAEAASERALVLHALGIDSAIVELDGRHVVAVAPEDGPRARAEIDKFERENPASIPLEEPPGSLTGGFAAALVYAATLSYFFRNGAVDLGRADAGLIRDGAWWRNVTALTLHADVSHLAGNLLFGSLFGVSLAESVGFGTAWLGFVLTGSIGNGVNAWIQSPAHTAIGASTGVFGMLGMQVAYDAMRRRKQHRSPWRRWAPLVLGVALLAWLGGGRPGERIDVWAHVLGFAAGAGLGALLGLPHIRVPKSVGLQGALAAIALGSVALAWHLAR